MPTADRDRSAQWHARNRAYREWVESNRELLEYLASSPDVPDHLRPAGALPARSIGAAGRPDDSARPAGGEAGPQVQNPASMSLGDERPAGRPAARGTLGGSSLTGLRELRPPISPHPDAARPAGAAARDAEVAQLITASGVPLVLTAADRRALRKCEADPAVIAEAFTAASRHEWGGDFLHQNLSIRLVVTRLSGWLAYKASLATKSSAAPELERRRDVSRIGPAPSAFAFEGRSDGVDPADVERFYGSTE